MDLFGMVGDIDLYSNQMLDFIKILLKKCHKKNL